MITLKDISAQKSSFFSHYDKTVKDLITYAMHSDNASGFRVELASFFGEIYAISDEIQAYNAFVVEIIHEATLLHDDVIDKAKTRRGKESSASKFGSAVSVLTGDLILSSVINDCVKKKNYRLLDLISSSIANLCEGEIIQNKTTLKELTLEKYKKIAELKTSSLIISSSISSLVNGGVSDKEIDSITKFASDYGIAYQMIDDMKDMLPESITGKDQYNDIDALSPSLPLLVYKNLEGDINGSKEEIIQTISSKKNMNACFNIIENQIEYSLTHLADINTLSNNYKLITLILEPLKKLKIQLANNL